MLGFLTSTLSVGSSAFALWRVIAIGVPVLIASLGGAYFVGELVGAANERTKVAAANTKAVEVHGQWLINMAEQNNNAVLDEAKRLQENETVQMEIENASAQPHPDGVCVSAEFLRTLRKYR